MLRALHLHGVHFGGAPALDLTGPENRAVVHTAASEDPWRVELHVEVASYLLPLPPPASPGPQQVSKASQSDACVPNTPGLFFLALV